MKEKLDALFNPAINANDDSNFVTCRRRLFPFLNQMLNSCGYMASLEILDHERDFVSFAIKKVEDARS